MLTHKLESALGM